MSMLPRASIASRVSVLLLCLIIPACATLEQSTAESRDLHDRIRSGTAVKTGERVRVTTRDGMAVLLTVTSVTRDNLSGDQAVYLSSPLTWGNEGNLAANPDSSTVITIPVDSINGLVDIETHESTRPTHAHKALMLAIFGILMVIAWTIP